MSEFCLDLYMSLSVFKYSEIVHKISNLRYFPMPGMNTERDKYNNIVKYIYILHDTVQCVISIITTSHQQWQCHRHLPGPCSVLCLNELFQPMK